MPNLIAFAALALWPVVTAVLFLRLPPGRALIAAMLAGYLLLPPPPAGFDLPLVPPLTKDTIPALSAAFMCVILWRARMEILPRSALARVLVAAFILSPAGTVLTNGDPIVWGQFALPGLRPREAIGMMLSQAITIAPFLMARSLLARDEDQRDLLLALVLGGLVYSLPMLIEVRLSPQINIWVYGYFQHNFEQMMRAGGFRPIVFLYHGLWVAFFAMTTVLAAVAIMRRSGGRNAVIFGAIAAYLFAVLILCKSFAAIFYALAFVPVILFLSTRWQLRLAALIAVVALVYPVMKAAHWVPEEQILTAARSIGPDREVSLRFRFDNETVLSDRAYERPLFGWGLWGRHHIMDDNGRMLTVTDGRWILVLGVLGWVGFLAEFGLLTLPLLMAFRRVDMDHAPYLGPVALILAVNVFDLIPNATITPLTWLFAGAILGYAESARARSVARAAPAAIRTVL